MKKRNNYDNAQVFTSTDRLPIGGYVLKIIDVEDKIYDWGEQLILSFDIAEGDQKDFFRKNYDDQDSENKKWKGTYRLRVPDEDVPSDDWRMRRFKTTIYAFEDSNPGFHWDWDETSLKDKLIGGLFNNKEYSFNGKHGFFTNCHSLTSAEKIRSGDFKIPEDTLLDKSESTDASASVKDTDFMTVPDNINDSEVPFS